jgi:WD40 repeat protein
MSASKRAAAIRQMTSPGIATTWLGDTPVFGFGDGTLLIDAKAHRPHDGGIVSLCRSRDGQAVFSAGEDGRVVATDRAGGKTDLFHQSGAWLDVILPHPKHDEVVVICGREVLLLSTITPNIVSARFKPARTPNSLAFDGVGKLLAIGHSAGVSLFETTSPQAPLHELDCSGGPVSVALDPTGEFLFTGLSEPALAGWHLSRGQGFRMGGYPGKPKQLSFHNNGKALLTSGGPALLIWPLIGKDKTTLVGPMGQSAGVYRPRQGLATAVASYGETAIVGWSDGGVDLVNLITSEARHIGGPRPASNLDFDPRALTTAIVSVAFRGDGKQVSWIGEQGAYGTAVVQ